MVETIETVIVGGGQAGLATSYYLTQLGREHLVLEQAAQAANAWRDARWDSFTLVTPNWTVRMPGAEYNGPDRDGFLSRQQVIDYFEGYTRRYHLPVQYHSRVLAVEPTDRAAYRVRTAQRELEAANVVVATGYEQLPKIPAFAAGLPADVVQMHSGRYRNPEALAPGAVLVVGSAQSGCQIAEELYLSGRKVFLCTGGAGRIPRRYRGRDAFEWLDLTGFFETTPDRLPFPKTRFAPPHLSGKDGGRTLNLHRFARDGVTLLGHLRGADGGKVKLAPDLHENLAKADGFERERLQAIDAYIQQNGLDAPEEEVARLADGFEQPPIEEIDLGTAGIGTIIWATGHKVDLSFVKLPVSDEVGFPVQENGVARYPGLYFVGLPWMPSLKTGILLGVGDAARHVASRIAGPHARVAGEHDLAA